jgi:hypothetical protein
MYGSNRKPVVDELVIGLYGEVEYYRARVTHVGEKDCSLLFVDFGDVAVNKFDVLYELNDEIMKVNFNAASFD